MLEESQENFGAVYQYGALSQGVGVPSLGDACLSEPTAHIAPPPAASRALALKGGLNVCLLRALC